MDSNDNKESEKLDAKEDYLGTNDYSLSSDYNLPSELVVKGGGVFAKANISSGTKYGPFIGKWETQPSDRRFAWEVCFQSFIYFD